MTGPSAAPTPPDPKAVRVADAAARRHAAKVARVAAQLRHYRGPGPLSLRKKSVSHQVPKAGDRRRHDHKIDVGDLTEILAIDAEARLCVAESGVTFVDLVTATLRHGLVPIVVPELKTITIGGAVAGCSIESTSFATGGFHDSCLEYEVVTATGEIKTCAPDGPDPLLFDMVHGTFGTLAILTRLTFRLMPATDFVHLEYESHATLADYLAAIRRHAGSGQVDFIDGIIHSPTRWVLCLGRFVERAPYTSRYDWVRVFWRSTARRRDDYMTTADYFFRYDRGVTNVRPRSLLGRLLFGRLLSSTQWLWLGDKFHWALARERPTITLDVFVPIRNVPAFMDWYQAEFGFFPLWCVPYRLVRSYPWLDPSLQPPPDDPMFLDLAIYGMRQPRDGRNYHRLMEQKLSELGGFKTLISHNYYGEDEFWSIWNRPNYQQVKAVTDPGNLLRDLYAKTCKAAMGRT